MGASLLSRVSDRATIVRGCSPGQPRPALCALPDFPQPSPTSAFRHPCRWGARREEKALRCSGVLQSAGVFFLTSHREEPTSPGEDTPRNASLRSLRSSCHRERARGSWHRIHVSLHILDFQTREAEVIFVCVTIFQDWEFQFFDHSVSLTPTSRQPSHTG